MRISYLESWSHPPGLNRRPTDYESPLDYKSITWLILDDVG
jgi:hypothetical protein